MMTPEKFVALLSDVVWGALWLYIRIAGCTAVAVLLAGAWNLWARRRMTEQELVDEYLGG